MWITLAKYLGPAALAAGVAWWITSSIDDAQYKALQVLQADAIIASQQKDLDALNAFRKDSAAASSAASAALAKLAAARDIQSRQLSGITTMEGNQDAALNACLDRKLPDGILRALAH